MVHTTTCEINFDDNPDRVYYGGQIVRGTVHLALAKEKTIRGNFSGKFCYSTNLTIQFVCLCHLTTKFYVTTTTNNNNKKKGMCPIRHSI